MTGRARYIDDLAFPNLLYARTIRSTIPAGEIAGVRFDFDTRRLHHRRLPRHPRPERRRADRGRSAVPRRARRSATSRSRSCCSRTTIASGCSAPTVHDRLPSERRRSTTRRRRPIVVQADRHRQGRRRARASPPPTSSSKASTAPAIRSSSTSSRTASSRCPDDRRRSRSTARCSVPYYVHRALTVLLGLPRRQGPRRPDGDRRRLRRQGRVPVDDRRPRRAAGAQVAAGR